jgi:hypothetical protein
MGANRNRSAGHGLETEEAKIYREELGYPDACTARSESRNRDNQKVDLCHTGIWNVQLKSSTNNPNYHTLINEMPQEEGQINIVCHAKTVKSKGGKFMRKGKYVTMRAEDFYKMQKTIQKYYPWFKG